jgi:hypothetical protein
MVFLIVQLITWGSKKCSFVGKVLVFNHVLLTSMRQLRASWNPNPTMNDQLKGITTLFGEEKLIGKEQKQSGTFKPNLLQMEGMV